MTQMSLDPQEDRGEYDADVTSLLEMGSSNSTSTSFVPSFNEWRADAYLLYNKPRVPLEDLITMRRSDSMARALANLVTLPIRLALQQGRWVAPAIGGADEEAVPCAGG